jgi:hypothetical protein
MNPISLALGAIGIGMSIFGGSAAAKNAEQQAQVSSNIAHQEQGINDVKQQAMMIQSRRQNLETVRNMQLAQAQARTAATAQNAQFGSGLQGGLGQITDQGLFNIQGVNQSVAEGKQINTYNQAISSDKMQLAQLGGDAAQDQALTSLGGTLLKIGPTVGNLSKGINFGSLFG